MISDPAACVELHDRHVAELGALSLEPASNTLPRDWEAFVSFYRHPKEHWLHLRASNPRVFFIRVWLWTDAAKRLRRRDSALYLVFKIVQRLSGYGEP